MSESESDSDTAYGKGVSESGVSESGGIGTHRSYGGFRPHSDTGGYIGGRRLLVPFSGAVAGVDSLIPCSRTLGVDVGPDAARCVTVRSTVT